MKKIRNEDIVVFLLGGVIYPSIEVLTRGYTHWTMAVLGGSVFLILYRYNISRKSTPIWRKCIFGMIIITALEFAVGCFANLIFKWNVWDYSNCPLNIMGQICLPFSLIWLGLCVPAFALCTRLEKALNR